MRVSGSSTNRVGLWGRGYRKIRHYKLDVRNFIQWQSHMNGKALERNGDFLYPLDGREVWHIAKSVSKWVWHKFDLEASDARFSELQARRGRKGGVKGGPIGGSVRSASYEGQRASARLMHAQGMSARAIARELGCSPQSVLNWVSK